MENEKTKFSEILLSPFKDNDETKKIKDYAKQLLELEDFKDLKMYLVYYKDTDTYKKKLKLVKLPQIATRKIISIEASILPWGGFYDYFSKSIIILLDNCIKYNKIKSIKFDLSKFKIIVEKNPNSLKQACSKIIIAMYHEKKHHIQKTEISNSFDSIMYQIEMNLRTSMYGTTNYFLHHDSWYLEIDANNYGVQKALEYYQKHTNDDNVDWDCLKRLEKIYKFDESTYDFDSFFTIYNIYKEKLLLSDIRNGVSNILLKNKKMPWHQVLYGNSKSLQSIDQILNHPLFDKIDPKFINLVLTSRYLNKNIDYSSLDLMSLKKLKTEFKNRLEETTITINKIQMEKDEFIISRTKRSFKKLKENEMYYKDKIIIIETKISELNKKIYK